VAKALYDLEVDARLTTAGPASEAEDALVEGLSRGEGRSTIFRVPDPQSEQEAHKAFDVRLVLKARSGENPRETHPEMITACDPQKGGPPLFSPAGNPQARVLVCTDEQYTKCAKVKRTIDSGLAAVELCVPTGNELEVKARVQTLVLDSLLEAHISPRLVPPLSANCAADMPSRAEAIIRETGFSRANDLIREGRRVQELTTERPSQPRDAERSTIVARMVYSLALSMAAHCEDRFRSADPVLDRLVSLYRNAPAAEGKDGPTKDP
jgi:hypothetical protein